MLDELNRRLREIDEAHIARNQGMWGSVSSVPSSNGSISFYSPHGVALAPTMQQQPLQPTPPALHQTPSYSEPALSRQVSHEKRQVSPEQFQQQQGMFPPPQSVQYGNAFAPPQPQPQQTPQQHFQQIQQQYSFNEPVFHAPAYLTAPHHQFGAWSGYAGPTVANTLNEENAVPPESTPWDPHNR